MNPIRILVTLVLVLPGQSFAQKAEYLPVCLKCLNPRIVSRTGTGSTNAVAEARVAVEDAKAWCAANKPRDPYCVKEEVAQGGDGRRAVYRASADCMTGRLQSMNGQEYLYAGLWTGGPGNGRPRLRDSGGNSRKWDDVVYGRGIARAEWDLFGGYSLTGQWEALCAGVAPGTAAPSVTKAASPARAGTTATSAATESAATQEWLSVCSKCPSPTVVTKSGTGSANAVAEARMTRQALQGWCSAEEPGNVARCVSRELADSGKKVYRAKADCLQGRITTIDEMTYALAGVWDNSDIGAGRTKWRGVDGSIVGRDNVSNGLAISQQWEVLCPGPPPTGRLTSASPVTAPLAAGTTGAAQVRASEQAPEPSARPSQICTGPLCTEVNSFAATITDFRTSTVSGVKVVTAAIRFQNKLTRPVILGYLSGSGTATDDQGNRYIATPESIRGIGSIANGQVDPKFVLRPGESADTRFEMVWRWSGREVFGLSFEMDVTVREVLPLTNGQLRLGQEHPLRFRGLTNAVSSAPPPSSSGGSPALTGEPVAGGASSAPATGPDPCTGMPRCFNAGPFLAEVQQINSSMYGGRHHLLRFNVKFRNLSSSSLILATTYNSLVATDNLGNRYGITPQAVNGMGVVMASKADPQFVLNPGQTRNASFEVYRRNSGNPAGISYTFDVSLEQLEILASQQIRSTRQFALNFPNLAVPAIGAAAPTAPASPESLSEAGRRIVDVFRKKK